MPHSLSRPFIYALAWLAVSGCAPKDEVSVAISRQLTKSNGTSVNLSEAAPGDWEKVCILGPYSNNGAAKSALGFEWNVESKTSIQTNEGISLLLFIKGQSVTAYVGHPRRDGDFTNLTTKCFLCQSARFFYDPKPSQGWPGLFQKDVA